MLWFFRRGRKERRLLATIPDPLRTTHFFPFFILFLWKCCMKCSVFSLNGKAFVTRELLRKSTYRSIDLFNLFQLSWKWLFISAEFSQQNYLLLLQLLYQYFSFRQLSGLLVPRVCLSGFPEFAKTSVAAKRHFRSFAKRYANCFGKLGRRRHRNSCEIPCRCFLLLN